MGLENVEGVLRRSVEIGKIINSIALTFLNFEIEEVDNTINHALTTIGVFKNVDRSYVILLHNHSGNKRIEHLHEWCRDDIERHNENQQDLALFSLLSEEEKKIIKHKTDRLKGQLLDNFPWFKEKINRFETIHVPSLSSLPPGADNERKEFQMTKTKSLVMVPIIAGGRLAGLIGFDMVREERTWTDDDIRLLKMVGHMIFLTIKHKREVEWRVRFRAILNDAGESFLLINYEDGHFIDVNKTAEYLLGYSREELLTMSIQDINASAQVQTPDLWKEFVKKIKDSGKPFLTQSTYKCKDNKVLKVEISFSCKTFAGEPYILALGRDISERERAKKLIELQQKQLIQADKMVSLGTMAAGVAHEINNPLSVAIGDLHLLKRDLCDITKYLNHISGISLPSSFSKEIEEFKKDMDIPYLIENFDKKASRCKEAMERIKEIVQDLKDFSHADKGEIIDFDINKGIESSLEMIPKKYKRDMEIKFDFVPLPAIPCYGRQLGQVFMNLMVNAFQAMKNGGTLKVKTSSDDRHYTIKFSDTGPGIPEDKIKTIFDPFYTTKPIGEGTGLGLAITNSIVEKHKGKVTVVNNPDKGVTFAIKLLKEGVK